MNIARELDGVAVDPTSPEDMANLVAQLADAKSRQSTAEALKLMHGDIVLDSPAFGTRVQGHADNQAALNRLFYTFPDYSVAMDGAATNPTTYTCWGCVRMTMKGERLGVEANGKPAIIPAFFVFGFRAGLIVYERMLIDLATLCSQSGVSTDLVRKKLFG